MKACSWISPKPFPLGASNVPYCSSWWKDWSVIGIMKEISLGTIKALVRPWRLSMPILSLSSCPFLQLPSYWLRTPLMDIFWLRGWCIYPSDSFVQPWHMPCFFLSLSVYVMIHVCQIIVPFNVYVCQPGSSAVHVCLNTRPFKRTNWTGTKNICVMSCAQQTDTNMHIA